MLGGERGEGQPACGVCGDEAHRAQRSEQNNGGPVFEAERGGEFGVRERAAFELFEEPEMRDGGDQKVGGEARAETGKDWRGIMGRTGHC